MPKLTLGRGLLLTLVIGLLAALALLFQAPEPRRGREVSYTGLLAMSGALRAATIHGNELTGRDEQGNPFVTIIPADPGIATRLAERGVEVSIAATPDQASAASSLVQVLLYYGSLAVLLALLLRIARALERERGGQQGS